ncbi:TPA: transposase [Streptococcus agalactiae]|nr:transposase [Streptococcus agalactiae]
MKVSLEELSKEYKNDKILIVCCGVAWHKLRGLRITENIEIIHISPYAPETNLLEQIWKQIRSMGFKDELFHALAIL